MSDITELKVGDYIETSEIDTEQKYNDVAEVFKSYGINRVDNKSFSESPDWSLFVIDKDDEFCGYDKGVRIAKRKLTYDQIMSLKKVGCDGALMSVNNIEKDKAYELMSRRAIQLAKHLGYEYDENGWYRMEKVYAK